MSIPSQQPSFDQPAVVLPFAYPLDEFYALAHRELPDIEQMEGTEMPEPYRELLVHNADMTPTLEKFHDERIYLNVISGHDRGDFFFREGRSEEHTSEL